ncbi:hypothetical protein ES288_A01G204400v1 [Gossypium darwinii]|uniref:GATA-type domain-containing protein n=1 Tax=Gossypium darwinii TaxID=34276 RepID=A0A5D2HQU7_GOSDA|nr:hypothetical protein ES288_A01G204400v1 [Gossypium darwinii]
MKKQGPCFHCGIDSTPLWRNGPPEKPVLCNACGSRYRLGKPLENYIPKTLQIIQKKKRKAVPKSVVTNNGNASYSSSAMGDYASSESSTAHNLNFCSIKQENLDDDFHPVEDLGSSWRNHSRKRSAVVYNSLTTIQKLERDLQKILRHEPHLFNGVESQDDVLIYNVNINNPQIPSKEIGLGTILLNDFPVSSPSSSHHQDEQEIKISTPNHAPTAPSYP